MSVVASEIRRRILGAFPETATIRGPAWIVGGAVRDALLGRSSLDVDVAADGAENVAEEFARRHRARLIELGRERFVSWRVVVGRRCYDFAQMTRGSIEADLGRRDFTINAMAIAFEGDARLIDPFDGAGDVERRCIRMVRAENLEDDPLRVLKAVRMVSVLGFELDPDTSSAAKKVAARLRHIAPERVASELEMIFAAGDPRRAARAFRQTGSDTVLFGRPISPLFERIDAGDAALSLAAIFHGEPEALIEAGEAIRLPGALLSEAAGVLKFDQSLDGAASEKDLDVLLHQTGERVSRRGAALREALGDSGAAQRVASRIDARGDDLFAVEPLLTGFEIAGLAGIAPGPILGRLKQELILAQVRGEILTREAAEKWLRSRAGGV